MKKSRRAKEAVDAAMRYSADKRIERAIAVLDGHGDVPAGVARRDWAMAVLRGDESSLERGEMGRGPR